MRSHTRVDGPAKLSGAATFAADTQLPDLAFAVAVTSSVPRGRILGFSLSRARSVPGFRGIWTHQQLAGKIQHVKHLMSGGYTNSSALPLGSPEIYYAGQIVALVVADTFEQASEAAALLQVDYAAEPAVATLADSHGGATPLRELRDSHKDPQLGDVQPAISQAACQLEARYTTPIQHHNPIELFSTTCVWKGEQLTIYEPTRYVGAVQHGIAAQLGLRAEQVRVVCPFLGGHFGSKLALSQYTAPVALAARDLQRPVRFVATRQQCFTIANHRPDTEHHITLASDTGGRFLAFVHEVRSTTSQFDNFAMEGTDVTASLYGWPNVQTLESVVRVNRNTPGPMRAPPEVPYLFAVESAVDELAGKLRLDPIELRRRNDPTKDCISGKPFANRSMMRCFDVGAEAFGWRRRNPKPASMRKGNWLVGYGCAAGVRPAKVAPASVRVTLTAEGTAVVEAAHHEIGNGLYTVLAMETAGRLGIDVAKVSVHLGDSSLPATCLSGGSSTTGSLVPVLAAACEQIRANGNRPMSITASNTPEGTPPDALRKVEEGKIALSSEGPTLKWAYAAQFAEVHIHATTCEIRVPRLLGAFAARHIVNRLTALSQLKGGMVWGMSSALLEATSVDPRTCRYVNDDLAGYLVPVATDVPQVDAILAEEEGEPLDLIGIGEIGIIGVNAAIANAIYHATGHRFRRLPIRIEDLLRV